MVLFFTHITFVVNHTINATEEVATLSSQLDHRANCSLILAYEPEQGKNEKFQMSKGRDASIKVGNHRSSQTPLILYIFIKRCYACFN